MRPSRRLLGAAAVLVVVVTAAVLAWRLAGGGDTAHDVVARLDLVDDGPFALRLGGALWDSRTLRDRDGAPDVAYVTGDEPLAVDVTGRGGHRPAAVDLRVDGSSAARRSLCAGGACPRHARMTVVAPVAERGAGPHRVTVIARGETGSDTARARFAGVEIFNLTGSVVHMREVVAAIEAAAPASAGRITFDDTALALPEDVDATPLEKLIGAPIVTPLKQAVGETVALFRERVSSGALAPDAMLK